MARRLPPAPPTTPEVRERMQRMPRRDTQPELALRRELHRRGLRYRTSHRPLPGLRCQVDIVFTRAKVACFVDSCHWHACDEHLRLPKTNTDWWRQKLTWTKERDERNNQALRAAGWTVLRVWEHEDVGEAADRVERAVRTQRADHDDRTLGSQLDASETTDQRPRADFASASPAPVERSGAHSTEPVNPLA